MRNVLNAILIEMRPGQHISSRQWKVHGKVWTGKKHKSFKIQHHQQHVMEHQQWWRALLRIEKSSGLRMHRKMRWVGHISVLNSFICKEGIGLLNFWGCVKFSFISYLC